MSCIFLSAKHISTISRFITTVLNNGYPLYGICPNKELIFALYDCKTETSWFDEKLVYETLYKHNMRAYKGRYPDEDIDENIEPMEEPAFTIRKSDYINTARSGYFVITSEHYKMLKLLSSFIYQCAEEATEKTELQKALSKFFDIFALFIASNNETYATADWII